MLRKIIRPTKKRTCRSILSDLVCMLHILFVKIDIYHWFKKAICLELASSLQRPFKMCLWIWGCVIEADKIDNIYIRIFFFKNVSGIKKLNELYFYHHLIKKQELRLPLKKSRMHASHQKFLIHRVNIKYINVCCLWWFLS